MQKVQIRGRQVRAVEYAFPRDLITGLPGGVFGQTETVDKSGRAEIPKRIKWILADKLLPPMRPYKEIEKPGRRKRRSKGRLGPGRGRFRPLPGAAGSPARYAGSV